MNKPAKRAPQPRAKRPDAWLHTLWMECNQKNVVIDTSKRNPFGVRGEDYSPTYPVTSEPLVRLLPKAPRPKALKR